jgi:uncharacterized SAM-binding protein YcdF (DUF218 family)
VTTNSCDRVAFVPSYCLVRDQSRLSTLSIESTEAVARLYKCGLVQHIVLSTAYESGWMKEKALKFYRLIELGVSAENIYFIEGVTSSYDEVRGLKQYIEKFGSDTFYYLVAEKYHIRRAYLAFQAEFPDLSILLETFDVSALEETYEPHPIWILGKIKGWRTRYHWSWWLWNKGFELLTPFLVKKQLAL